MELKKLTKSVKPAFPCLLVRISRGKFADARVVQNQADFVYQTSDRYYTHYCDKVAYENAK